MSSHGVARTARSRTQEQRQQDLEKIQKYRSLESQVRDRIAQAQYSPDTFALTAKILRLNPEYYTIWNARRRCLISGLLSRPSAGSSPSRASPNTSATATRTSSSVASLPSSSNVTPPAPDSRTAGRSGTTPDDDVWQADARVIRAELAFTIPLLIEFPKCYWIWGHRRWLMMQAIERLPVAVARTIWEEELGLVGKMLTKDRRNFHAWGYRRHVIAQLEDPKLDGQSMVESEFEYTTKMIHVDLSNFSAWHSRSQLIPRLLEERQANDESRKEFLEKELSLAREALNVGPEDQSLWYYHQYLILNLSQPPSRSTIASHLTIEQRKAYIDREIVDIKDLLEDYQDIKWIFEALLEYTVAIGQLTGEPLGEDERGDLKQWLERLRELDPMRSGRWKDYETELGLE